MTESERLILQMAGSPEFSGIPFGSRISICGKGSTSDVYRRIGVGTRLLIGDPSSPDSVEVRVTSILPPVSAVDARFGIVPALEKVGWDMSDYPKWPAEPVWVLPNEAPAHD